jgi:hypothetical protein
MNKEHFNSLSEADRHLRIFFSIDICDSTIIKSKFEEWTELYLTFFNDFPILFFSEVLKESKICKSKKKPINNEVRFWKFLGDELIFTAKIQNKWEAFAFTKAFYHTLVSYNESMYDKKSPLQFKGSAWTAGFPIRNRAYIPEIISNSNKANYEDYIGPDMDIGFRIGKLSRQGRVVVSMDLADILAQVSSKENFNFYHVGWEILKGVFSDKPYPVFWIVEEFKDVKVLPWEDSTCNFTREFLKNFDVSARNLRRKICEIREANKELQLFEPYFEIEFAPLAHKDKWKIQQKNIQKIEENADFGISEPTEQIINNNQH